MRRGEAVSTASEYNLLPLLWFQLLCILSALFAIAVLYSRGGIRDPDEDEQSADVLPQVLFFGLFKIKLFGFFFTNGFRANG